MDMSASSAYLNAPPPTFNTLDTRQRSRLIRSARKLGAVLGTTPHVLESDSPVSPSDSPDSDKFVPFISKHDRTRRQGSVFEFPPPSAPYRYDYASSSASSSVSSLALPRSSLESNSAEVPVQGLPTSKSFARHVREKKAKGKRAPLPTPLVLRLNAVPLRPSDPRLQPITPDTGATFRRVSVRTAAIMQSVIPSTPTSPRSPSTPTVTETRRKRLAKLKRTLGENVPTELIMPFRSMRLQSSPVDVPAAPQALSPPSLLSTPHRQPRLYPQQQNYTNDRPLPMPIPQQNATVSLSRPKAARKRSLSVDFKQDTTVPSFTPAASKPPSKYSHLRSPSHATFLPPQTARPTTHSRELPEIPERRSSRVWVTGAGSWTGEWNRKDIREVQNQLRNLKL